MRPFRLPQETTLEHLIKTKAENVAGEMWHESRARTENTGSDPVPQVRGGGGSRRFLCSRYETDVY